MKTKNVFRFLKFYQTKRSLIVAHVCQNNAYYILLTWLPTYFQENYPGSKGWIFNVVPWLISMPSTIFAGWLADKLIARSEFNKCYQL